MRQLRGLLTKRRILDTFAVLLVGLLIALLYFVPASGFGTYTDASGKIIPMKTFWDWLQLLIVPLILAVGGLWINSSIQQGERARADDRLQEQALQTYLDRMSELLLKEHLDDPEVGEKARVVARARTLTVLRGLDGERKGAVVRFLYESGLIVGPQAPTINLRTADLRGALLKKVRLEGVNLEEVNLEGAYLEEADLRWAHLDNACLKDAHLEGGLLKSAELYSAELSSAHLEKASLWGTNLENANLKGAHFESAFLESAHLERANLEGADLESAHLMWAHLDEASLIEAHFHKTNLNGAILVGAKVTQEQLDSANLDESTILPDGSHWKPPLSPAPTEPPQPPPAQIPPADAADAHS